MDIKSNKPPLDYPDKAHLDAKIKEYKEYPGKKTYINVTETSSDDLKRKYNIENGDSHVWVLLYSDGSYDKYENDFPFRKKLKELS